MLSHIRITLIHGFDISHASRSYEGLPVACNGLYAMHEGLPVMQRVCLSHAMTAIVIHMQLQRCHDANVMISSMQCEHDENTMMSCLCHADVKQTMMMWCSCNVNTNDIMPPHSYVAQMECKYQ